MRISVLGCGWLGFPLAQRLQNIGYHLKGSTTDRKKVALLNQNDIEGFLIKVPDHVNEPENELFWDSDILFLNIPPGLRGNNKQDWDYPAMIKMIREKAVSAGFSWIIFTSSTSVYGEFGGVTTEKDASPERASEPAGKVLLEAEAALQTEEIDFTILRLGGLYGYGRHPVHFLSGKKGLTGANKPVNLIHQTDCINIISELIQQRKRNEIYNLVSDGHPPRKAFYVSAAEHFNLPKPEFETDNQTGYKIVSNEKVKHDLIYHFSYPNPMDHTP